MENTNSQIKNLPKIKITKNCFKDLPDTPGVYFFFSGKKIIYIGKAINLKSRLKSYLNIRLGPKTKAMISEATLVSFIKVFSELEALLLEAKLINKFKPFYNIISKDDKHPLYIIITKEEFPRILQTRKLISNHYPLMTSFGPFPSSYQVKKILKIIRKIIPYSDHVAGSGKIGKKPCIYSQIGLCKPCPNTVFAIKNQESRKKQTQIYQKNIKNIKKLLDGKFVQVKKDLIADMNNFSKQKKYEKAAEIRDKIKTLEYVTQPRIPSWEYLKNPNLTEDLQSLEVKSLEAILGKNLSRIECYDVAHLAGSSPTASMVVFVNGVADKSKYRHFKIRQKKSQSDYDSMREVAQRRVKHLGSWGKPDLIVVDGGLGQVKIFNEIFESEDIPTVGIAKNPDRLVFVDGNKVRLQGLPLRLVGRMRDEAHRFARRLHHKLISKNLLKSSTPDVEDA